MKLESKSIFLRLVELSDAEFIHGLRVDETYNKYLSAVDDDVEKQRKWIDSYKEKEKNKIEYYFIICRKSDGKPVGTVRVYDFIESESSFCWGSWILNADKPRYAALECAILIYDLAFRTMGYKRCHMEIIKENVNVTQFHKNFGVKIVNEDDKFYYGHYFRDDYEAIRARICNVFESYNE